MRFLLPLVVLVTLFVLAGPAGAATRAEGSTGAGAVSGSASQGLSQGGRLHDGSSIQKPAWFGDKWWKKVYRAVKRFLEFIDGLIDDFRNQPGDGPGGNGGPAYGWKAGPREAPAHGGIRLLA